MSFFLENQMFPRSRGLLFSLKPSVKALTACWYHSSCLVFREVTVRNDSILEKVVVLVFFFSQVRQVDRLERDRYSGEFSRLVVRRNFFFRTRRKFSWPAQMDECGEREPSAAFARKNLRSMVRKKQERWIFISHWSAKIIINNWNFIQSPIKTRLLRNHIAQCRVFRSAAETVWMSRECDWLTASSLSLLSHLFLLLHRVWWCHSETASDWKQLCGCCRALKVQRVGFRGTYWQE